MSEYNSRNDPSYPSTSFRSTLPHQECPSARSISSGLQQIPFASGVLHRKGDFLFRKKLSKKSRQYFQCTETICSTTLIYDEVAGTMRQSQLHNHSPNYQMLQKILLMNDLKAKAREDRAENPKRIFDSVLERYPLAAGTYTYDQGKKIIQRARADIPTPHTVADVTRIMTQPDMKNDLSGKPFYIGTITYSTGSASIFVSKRMERLMTIDGWQGHCDATFACTPSGLSYKQLFTLHAFGELNQQLYPVVFALMERKTSEGYEAVLRKVASVVEGFVPPSTLMCDFEKALRTAFTKVFPGISIKGCWFHYVQAINRQCGKRGLKVFLRTHKKAQQVLRMLCLLPILPAHNIIEGMAFIKSFSADIPEMQPILLYVQSEWLERVGVDMMAIGDQAHRTNNFVESFYNAFNKKLNRQPHPSFLSFLRGLKEMENATSCERWREIEGCNLKRTKKHVDRARDDNLAKLRERYLLGRPSPDIPRFLLDGTGISSVQIPTVPYVRDVVDRFLEMTEDDNPDDPDDPASDPGESTTGFALSISGTPEEDAVIDGSLETARNKICSQHIPSSTFVLPGNVVITKLARRGEKRPYPQLHGSSSSN